jgi:hypothetical protein
MSPSLMLYDHLFSPHVQSELGRPPPSPPLPLPLAHLWGLGKISSYVELDVRSPMPNHAWHEKAPGYVQRLRETIARRPMAA